MTDDVLLHQLAALAQVVLIDLTLAGDNAVVVGMAVAGLPTHQRRMAILVGIGAAAALRIAMGAVALKLLAIVGLLLAGGLLLLWVSWRLFRELRRPAETHARAAPKTLAAAMWQIALADVSMSLDNVLAVAGAAAGHFWVLLTGLVLSVVLMGVAADLVARMLERNRWLAWAGLVIVLIVALRMIWTGGHEVADHVLAG
ncbi:MAG: YjbE family putative metal transport protein [Alphaproteobacteria bacterium]|nr:YjbE family putative metal transport protein [Alphaproteobacteria bacterium]